MAGDGGTGKVGLDVLQRPLEELCCVNPECSDSGLPGQGNLTVREGLHAKALHDGRVRGLKVTEAQFDEKWNFVEKKQKHCNPEEPADRTKGDQWDLTALDVESRFVVSMVIGKRTRDTTRQVIKDFADRTGKVPPALITTDDCNAYANLLLDQYGESVVPEGRDKPGRPRKPFKQWPAGSVYATVSKT